MDNFIKALSISMLMSGSFMTQAAEDIKFSFSSAQKAQYWKQVAQRNQPQPRFEVQPRVPARSQGLGQQPQQQAQPQPPRVLAQPLVLAQQTYPVLAHIPVKDNLEMSSLQLVQELQAQEDKMNRLASTKQGPEERARQMKEDQELALKMSKGWEPKAHAPERVDPDLEATQRLIRQLTGQESEQVISDALLAKALENDGRGGAPYYKGKVGDPYLEASLKLVRQLDAQEDPRGAYNLPPLKKKLTGEDIIAYEAIVTGSKLIKMDANVHSMTQSFARAHYAEIKRLEQTYLGILEQPNKLLTLEEMLGNLEKLSKRNDAIALIMQPIRDVFGLIGGYWAAPVDGETGLDIREVMSNSFILAERYGDGALANLAIIMADNTQTQGGCHPGVTGRLAHNFYIEVSQAIDRGF